MKKPDLEELKARLTRRAKKVGTGRTAKDRQAILKKTQQRLKVEEEELE